MTISSYEDSTNHVIFALMEALMFQTATDEEVRAEARRIAWELLTEWTGKLDRNERSLANLHGDLGNDPETFWRKHDMAVLIARLRARAKYVEDWDGEG